MKSPYGKPYGNPWKGSRWARPASDGAAKKRRRMALAIAVAFSGWIAMFLMMAVVIH